MMHPKQWINSRLSSSCALDRHRLCNVTTKRNIKNFNQLICTNFKVRIALFSLHIKLTVSDVVIDISVFLVTDNQLCSNHSELIRCLSRFLCQKYYVTLFINRNLKFISARHVNYTIALCLPKSFGRFFTMSSGMSSDCNSRKNCFSAPVIVWTSSSFNDTYFVPLRNFDSFI